MKVETFNSPNGNCQGKIVTDDNWNITVHGICKVMGATSVKYAAAAPADLRMSYMGSGLPYANEEIAYEGSPNMGEAQVKEGAFTFNLVSPNSYYKDNGATMVEPHVHFTIDTEYFEVPLPSARRFPNRSLTTIDGRANRVTGR
jgi:hypothetical protein